MELDGRVAVVTGAGAETGRAIALRLAAGGARVVVADVDGAAAQATVAAIEDEGGTAAAIATDVTDDDDIGRMIEVAARDGGGPHVLVNNAGGWGEANYPQATPAQWTATAERTAAGALVPMADVGAAVIAFVGDDELAGRVVLLRGGRPRRFLS